MYNIKENIKNYANLARWNKPIGTWLLFFPCSWGVLIAAMQIQQNQINIINLIYLCSLFLIGSFLLRGAGCTWNDIIDRNIDAKVNRTKSRPIATKKISVKNALAFISIQALLGLIILIQLPITAIIVAIASLILVALYPLMKRITYWPQAWLGATFNWGIWVGYVSISNEISIAVCILYIAGLFWTLGYDSIYAMQDINDDLKVGVKSTAILFKNSLHIWISGFYTLAHSLIAIAAILSNASMLFYPIWLIAACQLFQQIYLLTTIKNNNSTLYTKIFKSNRIYGLLIACALFAGLLNNPFLK